MLRSKVRQTVAPSTVKVKVEPDPIKLGAPAKNAKGGEKWAQFLIVFSLSIFAFVYWTQLPDTKLGKGKAYGTDFVEDIVQRRKNIASIEEIATTSAKIGLNVDNEFGELTYREAHHHNKQIVKIGQGYCRVYGNFLPWETSRICVKDLEECSNMCRIQRNCVGFAIAENPVDNWDNCKRSSLGRCVIYSEEYEINHQMYASSEIDSDSYVKSYDCYRYGENKGFFYFNMAVTREGDAERVENWSMVLSTQARGKIRANPLLAKTGENTMTYGALLEKRRGQYSFYFNYTIHFDEYLKSFESEDPVVTFEILGNRTWRKKAGRSGIFHGRVLTGHKLLHKLLLHAASNRSVKNGHFDFKNNDGVQGSK